MALSYQKKKKIHWLLYLIKKTKKQKNKHIGSYHKANNKYVAQKKKKKSDYCSGTNLHVTALDANIFTQLILPHRPWVRKVNS